MQSIVGTLLYYIPISMEEGTLSREMELLALKQNLMGKNLRYLRQEERHGIRLRYLQTVGIFTTLRVIHKVWDTHSLI